VGFFRAKKSSLRGNWTVMAIYSSWEKLSEGQILVSSACFALDKPTAYLYNSL